MCDIVKQCVESRYFQRGILGAILINTLSMGIEYHNQVSARSEHVCTTCAMPTSPFHSQWELGQYVQIHF